MDKPEYLKLDVPEYDVYRDGPPAWAYVLGYLLFVVLLAELALLKWVV